MRVELCGRHWTLERSADLESLWDELGEDDLDADERLPYWTELWPSSMLLGRHLCDRGEELAGLRCLDLGCGLGLTAMLAAGLGARVAALDYEWPALHFARRSAALNGVRGVAWVQMDWRSPAVRPGAFDRIWGGDVMYEQRFVAPVAAFLEHALAPGGRAWLAEPNRNVYKPFAAHVRERGWRCELLRTDKVLPDYAPTYPQGVQVTVNLWELRRP
jgi:predicted nicotinamide N-methyase